MKLTQIVNVMQRVFTVLGINAATVIEQEEPDSWAVTISWLNVPGQLTCRLAREMRWKEYRTISKNTRFERPCWVVYVEQQIPATYWEPPTSDEVEMFASFDSPEAALIETLLAYFRMEAYACIPHSEEPIKEEA